MITVKLFGLVRLDTGIKDLQIEAKNVGQLQKALARYIPEEKIKGCLVLVEGKPANRFTKLHDGDQVMLMSPVAGG